MPDYVVAEFNVARCLAPLDDPIMADFMAYREEINRLGDTAPGFIWRLKGENDSSSSFGVFDDSLVIVNLSVWESVETLHQYTYYTAHAHVYRRRADWFSKFGKPSLVMWWIERTHIPTAAEGKERLTYLQTKGASPIAFTFKEQFPPPVNDVGVRWSS